MIFQRENRNLSAKQERLSLSRSNQAQSVVDVLCMEAASLGVKIKTNSVSLQEIKTGTNEKEFQIPDKGWHYDDRMHYYLPMDPRASSVSRVQTAAVICWQRGFHHHIVPVYPALTCPRSVKFFFFLRHGQAYALQKENFSFYRWEIL